MSYATTKKRQRPAITGVTGYSSKRERRRRMAEGLRKAKVERKYTGWHYLFLLLKLLKAKHVARWVFDVDPPRRNCALYVNDKFIKWEHIRMNQLYIRVRRVTPTEPSL